MSEVSDLLPGQEVLWQLTDFNLRDGQNRVVIGKGDGTAGFPFLTDTVVERLRWTGNVVDGTFQPNSTQVWVHKNGNSAGHRIYSAQVNLVTVAGWFTRTATGSHFFRRLLDYLMIRVFISNAVENSQVHNYALDLIGRRL